MREGLSVGLYQIGARDTIRAGIDDLQADRVADDSRQMDLGRHGLLVGHKEGAGGLLLGRQDFVDIGQAVYQRPKIRVEADIAVRVPALQLA